MKINQSGRSMIEMLGVLAIIGVLSVGGIAGYSKAMNKYRTNKITDQVSMISANIRTLYAMQRNYTGLSTQTAKEMGAVPDEMYTTVSDANMTNSYNGKVEIVASQLNATDTAGNKSFMIIYNGLPRDACVAIASSDWGEPVAIKVDGSANDLAAKTLKTDRTMFLGCSGSAGAGTAVACPGGDVTVPLPVTSASTACNCTKATCSIAWKYY